MMRENILKETLNASEKKIRVKATQIFLPLTKKHKGFHTDNGVC
jgi:predicted nucleic-acid-binding protein